MALEDYLEPEIAVTAAVTAAIFSPQARKLIRKGVVYGLAGILIAGDAISSFARSVGQGVQEAGASAASAAQSAASEARTEATESAATSTAQKRTSQAQKSSTERAGGKP